MKKILYITSLAMLVGCGKEPTQPVTKKVAMPAQVPAKEESTFNEEESRFIELMAEEDIKTYLTGKKSLTEDFIKSKKYPEIIRISSHDYQKAYDDNEVKGDSLYLDKVISVKGTVLSIDKSFNDIYSVKLKGTGYLWRHPRAIMLDEHLPWMAELKKGQQVSLVCTGKGLWSGNAILKDCIPADNYAKANAKNLAEKLLKDTEWLLITRVLIFSTLHKKDKNDCFAKYEKINECGEYAKKFNNDLFEYIKNNGAEIKKDNAKTEKEKVENAILNIYHNYLTERKIKLAQKDQERADNLIKEIFRDIEKKSKNSKAK